MRLKRRPEPTAEPDMTPMIDMVFLLLIFFMVAATMSQVELTPDVELPVAPEAQVPEDLRNRGVVNILPVGFVTSLGEVVAEDKPYMVSGRMVSVEELTELIAKKRNDEPHLRVNMRIDRNVDFVVVRRAIKACAEAGVFDVIFASYQSSSGG